MTFPALTPSKRSFTPGEYPHTAFRSLNGFEGRVRHSSVMIGSSLRLSYVGLPEQDMLDILLHYQDTQGIYFSFALPADTLSGLTAADYTLTGFSWRYAAPPTVLDLPCDRYTVEVELESVESTPALISVGLRRTVSLGLVSGVAAASNGIEAQIGFIIDSGLAVFDGADFSVAVDYVDTGATGEGFGAGVSESIALSIAGGFPIVPASVIGASETISLSLDREADVLEMLGINSEIGISIVGGEAEVAGGVSDPDFALVQLLVPFDGANGSTVFVDVSNAARTITTINTAVHSDAQSKFYDTSGFFDRATNSRLSISSVAGLQAGANDFTIEAWIYPLTLPTQMGIARMSGSSFQLGYLFRTTTTRLSMLIGTGSSSFATATNTGILSTNTWQHVAFTKEGTTGRAFVNGVLRATNTSLPATVADNNGNFVIGTQLPTTSRDFDGYMQDLRVTMGLARYTATFTPPDEALPRQ